MPTLSQRKLIESIRVMEREWVKTHEISTRLRSGGSEEMRYRYIKMIGKGSFGVVVKIVDDNNKFFALKRVYQDRRYHNRELGILLEVDHPNIVNLVSYFHTDQSSSGMYLNVITEYAGVNLEEYIESNKNITLDEIRSIYKQILLGLEYLHGKNICHRDIKPSNILVDSNGMVKICDLGSAKVIKEGESNVTYICSRFYRAPENLLDYKEYDFKIDVWSVGCVMVEFKHPGPIFKGYTGRAILNRILEVVKANEDDLVEFGCENLDMKPSIGIRAYLEEYFDDLDLLDVFERSLVFSPHKRSTIPGLLNNPFFRS